MTIAAPAGSGRTSTRRTNPGWTSRFEAAISRSSRRSAAVLWAGVWPAAVTRFMAKVAPLVACRTRKTTPDAPAPSSLSTS